MPTEANYYIYFKGGGVLGAVDHNKFRTCGAGDLGRLQRLAAGTQQTACSTSTLELTTYYSRRWLRRVTTAVHETKGAILILIDWVRLGQG